MNGNQTVDEIGCVRLAYEALTELDPDQRKRALDYVNARLDCEWAELQVAENMMISSERSEDG